jgi:S-adenosylmethionine decarboxylase
MVNATTTIEVPTSGENYSAYEGAFEGPEKLLEIWFSPSAEGLRYHQNLSSSEESSEHEDNEEVDSEVENIERFSPPPFNSRRRKSHAPVDGKTGLRVIPKSVLDKMLALVKCTVLNFITNEDVDAYLLR